MQLSISEYLVTYVAPRTVSELSWRVGEIIAFHRECFCFYLAPSFGAHSGLQNLVSKNKTRNTTLMLMH